MKPHAVQRWLWVAATGLGLGLVAHLALLGLGVKLSDWTEAASRPAYQYAYRDISKMLPLFKRNARSLAKGWVLVVKPGEAETWRCLVRSDSAGREEVVKKIKRLAAAKKAEILVGRSKDDNAVWLPKVARVLKVLDITATAYDSGPVDKVRGNVGTTSIGERARFGIVAVDPRLIPYRSLLYIEGYGVGLAADTGGAIKGHRVDLCYNTTREALAWGRRKVKVYILGYPARKEARQVLEALASGKPEPAKVGF